MLRRLVECFAGSLNASGVTNTIWKLTNSLQKESLFFHSLFVTLARSLDRFHLRDLRHRHIPPGLIAGHARLFVDFDHDYGCSFVSACDFQRPLEILSGYGTFHMCSKACCVGCEINLQPWAI